MAASTIASDADVLRHLVVPAADEMDPAAAGAILQFRFDKEATRAIRRLLQKNNRGVLSAEERITLERYLRVGKVIDLFQAEARLAVAGDIGTLADEGYYIAPHIFAGVSPGWRACQCIRSRAGLAKGSRWLVRRQRRMAGVRAARGARP